MWAKRTIGVAVALAVVLSAAACRLDGAAAKGHRSAAPAAGSTVSTEKRRSTGERPQGAAPRITPPAGDVAPQPAGAETPGYAVGVRTLWLSRGDRPLRTLVFYPAAGTVTEQARRAAGSVTISDDHLAISDGKVNGSQPDRPDSGGSGRPYRSHRSGPAPGACGTGAGQAGESGAGRDVRPAPGRFPLVLFSHGLHGSPERYAATVAAWAAAGFVVAVPAYPHTCTDARPFERGDIVNQPADAACVIKMVRRLDRRAEDPLAGHIAVDRVAAVGHSAGGYTTTGLFVARHPTWLRAGVVIAGWSAPAAFAGPAATMLFVQGARDTVVPLATARAAYDAVPWTKSSVLLPDSWHADYMLPGGHAYPLMERTVVDFLRRTLNGDTAARQHLPADDDKPHP